MLAAEPDENYYARHCEVRRQPTGGSSLILIQPPLHIGDCFVPRNDARLDAGA